MRGVYECGISISSLGSLKTLMLFETPSTKMMEVLSASITDQSNTTNQQLAAGFYKITSLGTPTGTSITPTPMEQGDQASAMTVLGNLSAEPTTYSTSIFYGSMGFATLAGYNYQPLPEEKPLFGVSQNWGLKLFDTAPTSLDAAVIVRYREMG